MIKLVLRDVVTHFWAWLGPFLVVIASSATLCAGACYWMASTRGADTASIAISLLISCSIPAYMVTDSVTRLAISLQRRSYALWQIAGVLPRAVTRIVSAQMVTVGLVGSIIGTAIGSAAMPPLFTWLMGLRSAPASAVPDLTLGPVAAASVAVMTTALVAFAALPAARKAGRTPPLEILRESVPPQQRMSIARWVVAVALSAWVVVLVQNAMSADQSKIIGNVMPMSLVLALLVTMVGPLVFPATVRGWTALLPARISTSWYLARHDARHRASLTSAVLVPVVVILTVIPSFFAVMATLTEANLVSGDRPADYYGGDDPGGMFVTLVYMVGGPVVLAVIGTAVSLFVAGRDRARTNALLRAGGASRGTIVGAALAEGVIYVTSAAILGTAMTGFVAVTTAAGTASSGGAFTPVVPLPLVGCLAGGALAFVLLATVIPTLASLRRSVRDELGTA
ncbi:hypothetical protein ITJ44_15680 [Clavibacter sp. VKM Ac-2873]|uniref:FtsX-like permease family protein n=1 Tax=Clavibacter sp. VKM Ac-2873 TaxID=2783813 RepID=UPI00188A8F3D|nr:FtsX-like permease family protein [Clavibacter sp. VKM Ac-2873]MBF4619516.1 hypothetical protein [Clavibacter sp. VKM Ac-2873]